MWTESADKKTERKELVNRNCLDVSYRVFIMIFHEIEDDIQLRAHAGLWGLL